MPPRVVDRLEAVEVEVENGRRPGAALELGVHGFEQVGPVGKAGERVVIRLVAELLLELRHLRERVLEPAVLEQDARMAGEGHEQLDVGLVERADVAETLTDDEQPERPVLAAERRDDRVLEPARLQERVECMGGAPPREQRRRADRGDFCERGRIPRREPLLWVHQQLALRTADAAQRPLLVCGREEEDLAVLGAEQAARGDEKLPDREAELRRTLRRAHRLVEELDVLPLLALLHVAAEGRDARKDRNDEQEDSGRAHLEELDDSEAERRGRERAKRGGDERPSELRCLEALLGDRDHRRDEQDAHDVGHGAREQDEDPQVRRRVGRRSERAEDQQGDAAAERQLGEVERELGELAQLAPASVDDQRDERAHELSDQQRQRARRAAGPV